MYTEISNGRGQNWKLGQLTSRLTIHNLHLVHIGIVPSGSRGTKIFSTISTVLRINTGHKHTKEQDQTFFNIGINPRGAGRRTG